MIVKVVALILALGKSLAIASLSSAQADEITPTPTNTIIITSTPYSYEFVPIFEELLRANGWCTLPCWWGFRIGETTLENIANFLHSMQFDRQWKESIYSSIPFEDYVRGELIELHFGGDNDLGDFRISFGFDQEKILSAILLLFNKPSTWLSPEIDQFSLSEMLAQFEETPEIYIAENRSTFRISEYNLTALFRRTGVEARYMFDLSQDNPINVPLEALRLCLDITRTETIQLSLYNTSDREPFPDFFKTPENAYGLGISTEEFVQFFREHPDECLDIAEYKDNEGKTP